MKTFVRCILTSVLCLSLVGCSSDEKKEAELDNRIEELAVAVGNSFPDENTSDQEFIALERLLDEFVDVTYEMQSLNSDRTLEMEKHRRSIDSKREDLLYAKELKKSKQALEDILRDKDPEKAFERYMENHNYNLDTAKAYLEELFDSGAVTDLSLVELKVHLRLARKAQTNVRRSKQAEADARIMISNYLEKPEREEKLILRQLDANYALLLSMESTLKSMIELDKKLIETF